MADSFPNLPDRLAGLADVSHNLAWTWNRDARAIFSSIDPQLWTRLRYDPIALLLEVSAERLAQCAADPAFVARYEAVMQWYSAEQSSEQTWFAQHYSPLRGRTIAYFCAEFAFHHTVPIYSGGLGVLAGDHCKTASDLGVPLVGVGILYRAGYFDQQIRLDGWQEDTDDHFDLRKTALEPIDAPNGATHMTVVRTWGRDVHIRVWRLRVGRVSIYLLDTDMPENHPDDRTLLSKLYAGGPELRLKQEWLLGVGGVRVLRALGIAPSAWHANEGHAAFMLVERVRELVAGGTSFDDAVTRVRSSSTFTTHTPVAAGHDMFPAEQVAECAGPVWEEMGIGQDAFMAIGRHPTENRQSFQMTVAALRLSRRVNAVSRPHGVTTRRLWAPLWPDRREGELPIRHVTNGVHLATWMANRMMELIDEQLGADWGARVDDPNFWDEVLLIDDSALWRVHRSLKLTFLTHARERARRAFAQRSREAAQLVGSGVLLDPDALTIGFARRFATYKRADLLFHDVERLLRITTNPSRPVQIIFSGKAHPADTPGKRVLQEVYHTTRDPRFEGRIAFVEDYDLHLAHVLVQGVDLWLNVPRAPMEASGTSGMKAALNAVPQLSTVDGWWEEGFNGHNGWALTAKDPEHDSIEADAESAAELYDLLETDVVPSYYVRDAHGLPRRWINVMKHALRAGGSRFTARRMLIEYVNDYYAPSIQGDSLPDAPPTA